MSNIGARRTDMLEVLDEVEMQLENKKKDRGAKGHLILTSATF